MDDDPFDPEALAAAMALALGLRLSAEQLPGVVLHLRKTRRIAHTLLRFRLPERTENAPVFRS
jgi:hypothetical protein